MSEISGTAYHFRSSPASQPKSGWTIGTSRTRPGGMSNIRTRPSPSRMISGRRSNLVPAPFQPSEMASPVSSALAGSPVKLPGRG